MLTVRVNTTGLDNALGKMSLAAGAVGAVLKRAAAYYLQIQRQRIDKGVDVLGGAFREYTEAYWDLKDRAGRIAKGGWLRLTGDMLRSQKVIASQTPGGFAVKVEFTGSRPGTYFKGGGRMFGEKDSRGRGGEERLTVGRTADTVDNAMLAAVNNRRRSFIGVSKIDAKRIAKFVLRELVVEHAKKALIKGVGRGETVKLS